MHEQQNHGGVFVFGNAVRRGRRSQAKQFGQRQSAKPQKAGSKRVSASHHSSQPQRITQQVEHKSLVDLEFQSSNFRFGIQFKTRRLSASPAAFGNTDVARLAGSKVIGWL